jgi:hypothetical protein
MSSFPVARVAQDHAVCIEGVPISLLSSIPDHALHPEREYSSSPGARLFRKPRGAVIPRRAAGKAWELPAILPAYSLPEPESA